jgi:hypothetical protein
MSGQRRRELRHQPGHLRGFVSEEAPERLGAWRRRQRLLEALDDGDVRRGAGRLVAVADVGDETVGLTTLA